VGGESRWEETGHAAGRVGSVREPWGPRWRQRDEAGGQTDTRVMFCSRARHGCVSLRRRQLREGRARGVVAPRLWRRGFFRLGGWWASRAAGLFWLGRWKKKQQGPRATLSSSRERARQGAVAGRRGRRAGQRKQKKTRRVVVAKPSQAKPRGQRRAQGERRRVARGGSRQRRDERQSVCARPSVVPAAPLLPPAPKKGSRPKPPR